MWLRSACCSLCLAGAAWAAGTASDVVLQSPAGGWNAAGLVDHSDQPAVAYPYNLIDRGAQKYRTLIQGRLQQLANPATPDPAIKGQPLPKAPYTLVVNGNPMPLYAGSDGGFARPYAFGSGSNSIEIRRHGSAGGVRSKRVQFYEAGTDRPRAALRIIAAWDDNQAEVDMHVITPDGQHAFWASPVLQGGGGLDADSVDGAGPEMFSIAAPRPGTYHVYLNYWSNFGDAGYHFDARTRQKPIITARVTTIYNENTLRERRETRTIPLRKIGDLILVQSFRW